MEQQMTQDAYERKRAQTSCGVLQTERQWEGLGGDDCTGAYVTNGILGGLLIAVAVVMVVLLFAYWRGMWMFDCSRSNASGGAATVVAGAR